LSASILEGKRLTLSSCGGLVGGAASSVHWGCGRFLGKYKANAEILPKARQAGLHLKACPVADRFS
jgi:hypothetical protein